MKLVQERVGILAYTWSWYNDDGEEVSPIFNNQDEALDWMEYYKGKSVMINSKDILVDRF